MVQIDPGLCTGCGACAKACPWDAIELAATSPGTSTTVTTDMAGEFTVFGTDESDDDNTDDVHDACALDLHHAVEAVRATGRPIKLVRAWIQVAGAGTFGLVNRPEAEV